MKITPCRFIVSLSASLMLYGNGYAAGFNGVGVDLGNMYRLSDAKCRSISPEEFTSEKGKAAMSTDAPAKRAARELGQGCKVSPYVHVKGKSTFTMAEI